MNPAQGRAEESYSSSASEDENRRRKAPRRSDENASSGVIVATNGSSSAAAAADNGSAPVTGHGIVPDTFEASMLEARRTAISRSISSLRKVPTKYLSTAVEFMDKEFDSSLTTDLSHQGLLRLIWLMTKMKPGVSMSNLRVTTYGSLHDKLAKAHQRVIVNPVFKWTEVLNELGGGMDLFQDTVVTETAVKFGFDETWLEASSDSRKSRCGKRKATMERTMAIMDALRSSGMLPNTAAQPVAESAAAAQPDAHATARAGADDVPKASPVQAPPAKAGIGRGIVPSHANVLEPKAPAPGHGIVPKAAAAKARPPAGPPVQQHHARATPVNPSGPPPPKAMAPIGAPPPIPKAGLEGRRLMRNASTSTIVPYAASKSGAPAAAAPASPHSDLNNIHESDREGGNDENLDQEDEVSQHSDGMPALEDNTNNDEAQAEHEPQSESVANPPEPEEKICLFCMQNMNHHEEAPGDRGRCCARQLLLK